MKKRYYKIIEGKTVFFKEPLVKDGKQIFNPTEAMLLADGWQEHVPPTPPPYVPTRDEKIHEEIRARYTENDEFMITRQYLANPDNPAFKVAFEEYNAFVEEILAKYPEENE